MLVTIKYFGMLVESTKLTQETINISTDTTTIQDLENIVLVKYPTLQNSTYNIAQNQKIADKKQRLNNGDELAFLPPFAGG
ncbi:molybdopterin converting factor subunit 1 [Wenyingzhuangia heitensis]|uniref:Molybdopterin converting factor subunit 1 n=1 Tax=Wenyingzhuangia heitensis TaxID=1487859 RepID=A0ABX0U7R8_9FLAO|nr:MoaD/ThiS family protein [Wenyingzhuangia heitensis]NIJ44379.1 molybdopterin converting factor subunit 1 [Wenyingzhuangia heitensis]